LHAAIAKSGPDTDSIGAAISGRRSRFAIFSGRRFDNIAQAAFSRTCTTQTAPTPTMCASPIRAFGC
jgi:hypothetical protein